MTTRKQRLNLGQVNGLIKHLLRDHPQPSEIVLLAFAEQINGGFFAKPKSPKPKSLSIARAKKAVFEKFNCSTITELRKNKTFSMAFAGEKVNLKSASDWRIQYRKWVGVPEDERNLSSPSCINGIDIFENFRPWHVFDLTAKTASEEDIKSSFRKLAKVHHPDAGGDAHVFERLQKMRDSLLALIN